MSKVDDCIFGLQDYSHDFNQCMIAVDDIQGLFEVALRECVTVKGQQMVSLDKLAEVLGVDKLSDEDKVKIVEIRK